MKHLLTLIFTITSLFVLATTTQAATVQIRARGTSCLGRYPQMQLKINGRIVKTWNVTGSWKIYSYTYNAPINALAVAFPNDCYRPRLKQDRNLYVDWVSLSGTIYQTSETATATGCKWNNPAREVLACPGEFRYNLAPVGSTPTTPIGTGVNKEVGVLRHGTFVPISSPRVEVGKEVYLRFTITGSEGVTQVRVPPPVDVALVMDRSGSMGGTTPDGKTKINAAKEAMIEFVNQADPGSDRLGLASYAHNYRIDQPLTSDLAVLSAAISRLSPGGWTSIGGGLWRGLQMLQGQTREVRGERVPQFVVLATDGLQNTRPDVTDPCPVPEGCPGGARSILDLAVRMGVPVYTVGFGVDVDSGYLQYIARTTGGKYFPANSARQLKEVYGEISKLIRRRYVSFQDYLSPEIFENPRIERVINYGTSSEVTPDDLGLSNWLLSGDLRDKLGERGKVEVILKAKVRAPSRDEPPPWEVSADDEENHAGENKVVYTLEDGSQKVEVSFPNPQLQVCQVPGRVSGPSASYGLCVAPERSVEVEFKWERNRLAKEYILEISDTRDFPHARTQRHRIDADSCLEAQCSYGVSLPSGTWYWRVGTKNDCVAEREVEFSDVQRLDVFECAPIQGTVYQDREGDGNYRCEEGEEFNGESSGVKVVVDNLPLEIGRNGSFSTPSGETFYTEAAVNRNLPAGTPHKERPYLVELSNPPVGFRVEVFDQGGGDHIHGLGSSTALVYGGARIGFCLVRNPKAWFQTKWADVYFGEGITLDLPDGAYFMQGDEEGAGSEGVILGSQDILVVSEGSMAFSRLQEGRNHPWVVTGYDDINSPEFVFVDLKRRYEAHLSGDGDSRRLWEVKLDSGERSITPQGIKDRLAGSGYSSSAPKVIFLEGNLTFDEDWREDVVVYFVRGNVQVLPDVKVIEAAIIFTGRFETLPNNPEEEDQVLEIKGMVIGLPYSRGSSSPEIVLRRKRTFNDEPAERFIYDPGYLVKFQDLLGLPSLNSWQEIQAPRR